MIRRIYIDTSVIGGLFDHEFQSASRGFFERVKREEFKVVYSEITAVELAGAPAMVRAAFDRVPSLQKEFVLITQEAVDLADAYIKENVVGKTSRADCLHIALATIQKVDILVSWNFKHIVNIDRIRGYNSVNLRLGYQVLEIRTPEEV